MPLPIITALTSYGMSGEVFHAPVISAHKGFQLKYILERTKERSSQRYPNAQIVRSYQEILDNPSVELVIVNTPNALHYSMTKAALMAGKHVVVEKPFTVVEKEGEELIKLAEEKGLVLSVFHNKRLEGEFKTIQKLIRENTLGELVSFETHFDRYRPEIGSKKWKEEENPGAGLLYDLGPHMIDQVLVLFGMPKTIVADLQIQREGGKVTDYFKITMAYESFTALVTAGMFAKGPVLKYEIMGSKGTYKKYGNDPQEEMLKQGISPLSENWGKESNKQWGTITTKEGSTIVVPTLSGTYLDYYTSIYDALRNNVKPVIASKEALLTIRIIEMALKSHLLGKAIAVF